MADINVHDLQIESSNTLQALANIIRRRLKRSFPNRNLGFALLAFDFGGDGFLNYVSNANRKDMITMLREMILALESGASFTTRQRGAAVTEQDLFDSEDVDVDKTLILHFPSLEHRAWFLEAIKDSDIVVSLPGGEKQ